MTLRPAIDADLPAIAALHRDSWRHAYRDVLPAPLLGAPIEDFMAAKWAGPVAGREVLVLEEGGGLAGFAALFPAHPDGVLLDNLHVGPDLTGRGLGRTLMAGAAGRAGARPLWLEVLEANRDTRAIYRAWGGREGPVFEDRIMDTPVPALTVRWPDAGDLARRLAARGTR